MLRKLRLSHQSRENGSGADINAVSCTTQRPKKAPPSLIGQQGASFANLQARYAYLALPVPAPVRASPASAHRSRRLARHPSGIARSESRADLCASSHPSLLVPSGTSAELKAHRRWRQEGRVEQTLRKEASTSRRDGRDSLSHCGAGEYTNNDSRSYLAASAVPGAACWPREGASGQGRRVETAGKSRSADRRNLAGRRRPSFGPGKFNAHKRVSPTRPTTKREHEASRARRCALGSTSTAEPSQPVSASLIYIGATPMKLGIDVLRATLV
ncbi:hypothetical protein KM043_007729 [Ampulex compressa]|nr:hypothetical protein KM043_007729 [Ampulex compressa]